MQDIEFLELINPKCKGCSILEQNKPFHAEITYKTGKFDIFIYFRLFKS